MRLDRRCSPNKIVISLFFSIFVPPFFLFCASSSFIFLNLLVALSSAIFLIFKFLFNDMSLEPNSLFILGLGLSVNLGEGLLKFDQTKGTYAIVLS